MATNFYAPKDANIKVSLSDDAGNAMEAQGTVANLPSAVAGYAVSCTYRATDSGAMYINTGTASSCTFTLMDTASTSLQLPEAATDSTTVSTVSLDLTQNAVTTGTGLRQTLNALTSGIGYLLQSSATAITSAGRMWQINHSGATTTSGIIAEVISAATDETVVHQATATAAITGVVSKASGLATVTGIIHESRGTAATLTTGRYYSAHDAAGEVFGIGTNGHIISTASATPPTIAVSQQNGITAAAITAGGTDTSGVITTTGTNNNGGTTVLQVTFGKTYTTAPKGVMVMPANAAAAKMSSSSVVGVYVSATAATTFDITIPADSTALATPSFRYMVIQ